ncbi:hydrophobic domain protein [Striga asiatica]|uniref:Hydrophobic domain protein n=1 Tax=Striga asiatica TaxID=4170 RepID=A0A5A7PFY6_STRAF|nr:hydrophobic domain protein [Striga asiatica]
MTQSGSNHHWKWALSMSSNSLSTRNSLTGVVASQARIWTQIVLDSSLASAVMRSPRTTAYLMAAVNIRFTFSDSDKFATIDWINCLWVLSKLCQDAPGSDWCAVGSWSVRGGKAAPSWLGSFEDHRHMADHHHPSSEIPPTTWR